MIEERTDVKYLKTEIGVETKFDEDLQKEIFEKAQNLNINDEFCVRDKIYKITNKDEYNEEIDEVVQELFIKENNNQNYYFLSRVLSGNDDMGFDGEFYNKAHILDIIKPDFIDHMNNAVYIGDYVAFQRKLACYIGKVVDKTDAGNPKVEYLNNCTYVVKYPTSYILIPGKRNESN